MTTSLVTGAGRGIGLELVRQLRARGDDVIATVRRPEAGAALAELGARVEALDVDDPASVDSLAARLEGTPVDLLINNAGVYGQRGADLDSLDLEDALATFRTNALGPLRVTRALLPALRAGAGKRVVQVTSKMGSIDDNGSGGSYGYRASKAALNALNRSLSVDLAPEGFTCVVLHPGWVQTDMGGSAAPVSVEESARGMLAVLDGLGPGDTGRFFDFRGEEIPW